MKKNATLDYSLEEILEAVKYTKEVRFTFEDPYIKGWEPTNSILVSVRELSEEQKEELKRDYSDYFKKEMKFRHKTT